MLNSGSDFMKNNALLLLFLFCGIQTNLKAQSLSNKLKPITVTNKKIANNKLLMPEVRMLNPICPPGVYIADPEVRQMPDGRVYLYGSRDEPGNAWCSRSYNVLSTSDLVDWKLEQTSFATAGVGKQTDYTDKILYAPDCIQHDGKYYLYYCLEGGGKDEG